MWSFYPNTVENSDMLLRNIFNLVDSKTSTNKKTQNIPITAIKFFDLSAPCELIKMTIRSFINC